ncbi:hypothetical protein Zmor_008036 [Zophobas morio]|uniref:Uncharacterized protein n=1 Tax=Zophobas morio TaxID=2755281 RepID=A0AA38IY71_9CUCU|nr:hypothetical protein Zmor_008036 [Zophobas morio]
MNHVVRCAGAVRAPSAAVVRSRAAAITARRLGSRRAPAIGRRSRSRRLPISRLSQSVAAPEDRCRRSAAQAEHLHVWRVVVATPSERECRRECRWCGAADSGAM